LNKTFKQEGAVPARMHVTGPVAATPEQLAKLRSELDVVNSNLTVLRDLLSGLSPGQESADELQLLQQLFATSKEMQSRVLELVPIITNEEVTYELLFVNDELNNTFEKYNRYMTNRNSRGESSAAATASASSGNLIDLGTTTATLGQQLEALDVSEGSRKRESYIHDQTNAGLHTAAFDKTKPISEREAQEMAGWLAAQESPKANKGRRRTLSSVSQFDTFPIIIYLTCVKLNCLCCSLILKLVINKNVNIYMGFGK
jgi:hypothetical protein